MDIFASLFQFLHVSCVSVVRISDICWLNPKLLYFLCSRENNKTQCDKCFKMSSSFLLSLVVRVVIQLFCFFRDRIDKMVISYDLILFWLSAKRSYRFHVTFRKSWKIRKSSGEILTPHFKVLRMFCYHYVYVKCLCVYNLRNWAFTWSPRFKIFVTFLTSFTIV